MLNLILPAPSPHSGNGLQCRIPHRFKSRRPEYFEKPPRELRRAVDAGKHAADHHPATGLYRHAVDRRSPAVTAAEKLVSTLPSAFRRATGPRGTPLKLDSSNWTISQQLCACVRRGDAVRWMMPCVFVIAVGPPPLRHRDGIIVLPALRQSGPDRRAKGTAVRPDSSPTAGLPGEYRRWSGIRA